MSNYNGPGLLPPAAGGGLAAVGGAEGISWMIILGITFMLLALALIAFPQVLSGGFGTWRNNRIDPYAVQQTTWKTTSTRLFAKSVRGWGSFIKSELRPRNRRR